MITVKDVEHVAKLARLELTEEEKTLYTKQLGDVLKYVDQMNEVDTSNVKPMTQVIDFVNVMSVSLESSIFSATRMLNDIRPVMTSRGFSQMLLLSTSGTKSTA